MACKPASGASTTLDAFSSQTAVPPLAPVLTTRLLVSPHCHCPSDVRCAGRVIECRPQCGSFRVASPCTMWPTGVQLNDTATTQTHTRRRPRKLDSPPAGLTSTASATDTCLAPSINDPSHQLFHRRLVLSSSCASQTTIQHNLQHPSSLSVRVQLWCQLSAFNGCLLDARLLCCRRALRLSACASMISE